METQTHAAHFMDRILEPLAASRSPQNKLTIFLRSVLTRLCRTRSSFKGLKRGTQRWHRCWTNACATVGRSQSAGLRLGRSSCSQPRIGMSPNTIVKGLAELAARREDPGSPLEARLRVRGLVASSTTDVDPELADVLERLVNPATRGDPMSPLRWTCKSTYQLATELTRQGHPVSLRTVGRLLKAEWLQPPE